MTRIILGLLAAGILASGAVAIHSRPVHAAGSACWFSDNVGQAYPDWYKSGTWWDVHDTGTPGTSANTDIQAWRLSTSDGHCWRGYYASTWTNNGVPGTWQIFMRVWRCGSFFYSSGSGNQTGPRAQWVTQSNVIRYVQFPGGNSGWIGFDDYGSGSSCLPQMDNPDTNGRSDYWGSYPRSTSGGLWYLNF